ncbi:MAG: response regulator transcription factor [Bryobacteraceae bacterium]
MTTVAICDIEPVAMEGLRALLESADLRVVAAETSLPSAIDAVRELQPSMLIVDRAFGIQAVTEWIGALRISQPSMAILAWSSAVSEIDAMRLLQAGAHGVMRKTAPLADLLNCIRSVAAGGTWMDDEIPRETAQPVKAGHSPLTFREMQVMELVERGMKNKEIGDRLGIRAGTVKIHLKHIFEKTGIRGRYGLALSGLREKGLLALVE